MNRGSAPGSYGTHWPGPGFNEAPIHESGKYASASRRSARTAGFNEAPIHESGKSHAGGFLPDQRGASMRPRFMNRGSVELIVRVQRIWLGFNEAPIHESGKWPCRCYCLSFVSRFNEAPIHESGKS